MTLEGNSKRGNIAPSMRGQFYSYKRGDKVVVCPWPKKRPKKPSVAQKAAQDAFLQVVKAMKLTALEIQIYHRWNAEGTPMLPRDSLMAALYGRGPAVHFTSGKVIKPMASVYEVSGILDALGWTRGDVLYRGEQYWKALSSVSAGYVLTCNGPGQDPTWEPPAAPETDAAVLCSRDIGARAVNWQLCNGRLLVCYEQVKFSQVTYIPAFTGVTRIRADVCLMTGTWTVADIVASQEVVVDASSSDQALTIGFPDEVMLSAGNTYGVVFSAVEGFASGQWGGFASNTGYVNAPVATGSAGIYNASAPMIGTTFVHSLASQQPWILLR